MSDADRPDHDDLADGEVLAAYLDGGTDEVTTARLERRLAGDPALARRLDDLAAARARLQRLSEVRAPEEVRRRLRARITQERATSATAAATGPVERGQRRRAWMAAVAPRLAVAVVALVALVALGAAVVQLLGSGAPDSGSEGAAMAASEAAGTAETADLGGAEAERGSDQADAAADSEPAPRAVPTVRSDQQIIDRAVRQQPRRPGDLRARERRLRQLAGLPNDRLCVADLDALTVDLVERDGRLVLAVLVDAPGSQIVLVDPRTCAPERTIPAGS